MPTLTSRSVIKFDGNAMVISLPKAWADYYGLKPGDRLRVVADDVLVIHPPPSTESRRYADGRAKRNTAP